MYGFSWNVTLPRLNSCVQMSSDVLSSIVMLMVRSL